MKSNCLACLLPLFFAAICIAQSNHVSGSKKMWCHYPAKDGPGKGKKIVLISGDDEYRSEEALPMLGKILAVRHGFDCSVLFPINKEGTVQPDYQENIPGMHLLEKADLVVLGMRFRNLPDEDMKFLDDYLESGKPIIAIRTSTHAFRIPKDRKYSKYSFNAKGEWPGGFGQQVLGDTWVSHHGKHGQESTRGIVNKEFAQHPVLHQVKDVWGPTDVYEIIRLPKTAKVLLYGQVLDGMSPDSEAVEGKVNSPMMPLAWTTTYQSKSGKSNKIFCTTMGAATDFESADLRRLIVNATYWSIGLQPRKVSGDVDYVDPYDPTEFGFGNYKKNRRTEFYNLKSK